MIATRTIARRDLDLDALVSSVTTWPSWAKLEDALQRGYCPTLRPWTRRARLLAKVIRACGYKVFNGRLSS